MAKPQALAQSEPCHGPGCKNRTRDSTSPWIFVNEPGGGGYPVFCSYKCIRNWADDKSATEEA